jgi:hypothetical protein
MSRLATNVVFFCVLLFSVVLGVHDHATHPDIDFIKKESTRVAYDPLEIIVRDINRFQTDMRMIEDEYTTKIEPILDDHVVEIWETRYLKTYRDLHDRLLILSEVCMDVYNDDSCRLPDSVSKPEFD